MSSELIETLAKADSPTVSNATAFFKVRDPTPGYTSMELRCQYPRLRPMVGYAVTCTVDTTSPLPEANKVLNEFFEAIHSAPTHTIVVVEDVGPQRLRSCHAGDVLRTIFQKLGAVGVSHRWRCS